jgi:tetratricopeptide (TPR) repeat protein
VVIDRVLADRQQRAIQRVLQILDSLKQADPIEELALLAEARLLSRDLLGAHPRAYRHIFALTSNNLGKRLGEAGRLDEAVPPLQDAVRTYRSLAAEDRALFLIDLATSLNNVAAALHNLEDEEHARAPADESVVLCRELVSRDSVANTRYLIAALNTQWAVLNSLGQTQPALKAIEAVVACGRDAVASGRSEALESLAMSLSNAAIQLDSMGLRTLRGACRRRPCSVPARCGAELPQPFLSIPADRPAGTGDRDGAPGRAVLPGARLLKSLGLPAASGWEPQPTRQLPRCTEPLG